MRQLVVFTVFLALFGSLYFPVEAASAFKKALAQKKNIYIDKGTIIGGEAGEAFSLMQVRAQRDQKRGLERVVLNLGDDQGQLLNGRLSFFQVNLVPEKKRMVIDLSQVSQTRVAESDLVKAFKGSKFVKDAQLIPDLEGHSLSLVLNLKAEVKTEVFQLAEKGKPGRLVIDLVRR